MTLIRNTKQKLTDEEWKEMTALKDAMNYDISQVCPEKMELFTALLVQTLEGKGDART